MTTTTAADASQSLFADPIHAPFRFDGHRGDSLLIHGFPGTPAEMLPAASVLVDQGVSAVGLQLPGMGRDISHMPHLAQNEWRYAAGDAWHRVASSTNRSILVGFSMGGALSIDLATEHSPDLLILLSPFWRFGSWMPHFLMPFIQYIKPTVSAFETGSLDDPKFRESIQEMVPEADLDDPATVEDLKESMVLPTRVINYIRQIGLKAYRAAPRVTCPVLVIQGRDDSIVFPQLTGRLVRQLRSAERVVYHEVDGDHAFPKDDGPFQEIISDFIAAHI
ncbi:MAG: alpha/beta fold hydrolase [Chloroflexota bacterium]